MTQAVKLLLLLFRHPIWALRAHLRLIARGLHYLSENPDLAWALDLVNLVPASTRLTVVDRGKQIFTILLNGDKGKPQEVVIDSAIFDRINSAVVTEKKLDAFYIAGRELFRALAQGLIKFDPIVPDAEMLASLDPEELLCKFGPRFGVGMENPVRISGVVRGLRLTITSPLTRRKMAGMIK